jgi:G protein beta subunit-like protein
MSVVLATAGYDHKIRFWEAPSGVCSRIIKFSDSQVNRLEITPDKQFIAAAGNPAIRLYEILSGGGGAQDPQQQQQAVLTLEGHAGNVTAIGFQKDGRYLYSGSEDGTIKVWDLRNPVANRSLDVGAAVNSVALRTDRDEFISGDQDGNVKIWDLGGRGCIHSIQPAAATNKESSSANEGAGGAGHGSSARRRPHHQYSDWMAPIQSVSVSEDSRTLVAMTNKGTVFAWDPSSSSGRGVVADEGTEKQSSPLRPITTFRVHTEQPGTYTLHGKMAPDCRHWVCTASDGTAELWDTTTWELTQTLRHPKWVWDAAFCADSSYLVTACSDHVARLWNLRTGSVVRQYFGHPSAVTCVALNDSSV